MVGTKNRFIDQTLELWQQRSTRVLTREDARQIIDNTTGFFRTLLEWETAERNSTKRIGSMKRADGRLP